MSLTEVYRPSLALLTDLYQLTMATGYWRAGLAERPACFSHFFRRAPFGGAYAVAAGLSDALDFLEHAAPDESDLAYLRTLTNADGSPLFDPAFIDYLGDLDWRLDVDAVPEGTVVFPHAPLLRVTGPLLQAQIVETALLAIVNFQTLVATKAARVVHAARGEPVLEFGLRRAQGIDGGLSATRAAYIGGVAGSSNVLAGKLYGIPIRGTHAHSWVMTFDTELEAFERYAEALPKNCIFLVDTYDTIEGVRNAVRVGKTLRAKGFEMVGVRLDSGDLGTLAKEARRVLDEGGFPEAKVVASSDLDEHRIEALEREDGGCPIDVWGVGTRLVTAHDQPALGGVYKLAAVQDAAGRWEPRLKLSDTPIKQSIPGLQQVRRYQTPAGAFLADGIFDALSEPDGPMTLADPEDPGKTFEVPPDAIHEDLLVPVLRGGKRVGEPVDLRAIRARASAQLAALPPGVRRNRQPAPYFCGIEQGLATLRARLQEEARR